MSNRAHSDMVAFVHHYIAERQAEGKTLLNHPIYVLFLPGADATILKNLCCVPFYINESIITFSITQGLLFVSTTETVEAVAVAVRKRLGHHYFFLAQITCVPKPPVFQKRMIPSGNSDLTKNTQCGDDDLCLENTQCDDGLCSENTESLSSNSDVSSYLFGPNIPSPTSIEFPNVPLYQRFPVEQTFRDSRLSSRL